MVLTLNRFPRILTHQELQQLREVLVQAQGETDEDMINSRIQIATEFARNTMAQNSDYIERQEWIEEVLGEEERIRPGPNFVPDTPYLDALPAPPNNIDDALFTNNN